MITDRIIKSLRPRIYSLCSVNTHRPPKLLAFNKRCEMRKASGERIGRNKWDTIPNSQHISNSIRFSAALNNVRLWKAFEWAAKGAHPNSISIWFNRSIVSDPPITSLSMHAHPWTNRWPSVYHGFVSEQSSCTSRQRVYTLLSNLLVF